MGNDKEDLYNQYKLYSDEKLKEITVENGYTEEAEETAQRVLNGTRSEYMEYLEQQEEKNQKESEELSNNNTIANILQTIGFGIMALCTMGSIYLSNETGKFSFTTFLTYEFSTIVAGMLFLGLAEVINLLQKIYNKLK